MRRDVLTWARQASKVTRHTTPPVRPIEVPAERFTHVHVNIVGPFPPDRGNRYLLTMVDRTTRWPEAVPLANTSADMLLEAFLTSWVARFGVPYTVTSDRGAQFTSAVWQAALSKLGINAFCNHVLPPAGEWNGRTVPSDTEVRVALCGEDQRVVDPVIVVGVTRHPQRPQARYGNVHRRGDLQGPTSGAWSMLPERTITAPFSIGAARVAANKRGQFHP